MTAAIDCHNLSKRYARSEDFALKDLSLQVQPGEVYGFLGPNGAGKSTAIRTLLNFIQPSSGSATILGKDIVTESVAIKSQVGYLAGDVALYSKLTGRQLLDYMAELQPPSSQAYQRELTKRFQATLDKPLGALSRGNRQKIGIIQAFMHEPRVLILDEPSSGLDPLMQEEFYALLREAKQRGATVFTSSHVLSEVQKICDRVGIIRNGRLIAERSIAEMTTEAAQTFDITFADRPPLAELRKITGLKLTGHHNHTVTIHIHGELAPLFALLAKHHVRKLDAHTLDLEEVFLHFYKNTEESS